MAQNGYFAYDDDDDDDENPLGHTDRLEFNSNNLKRNMFFTEVEFVVLNKH
jgi:hypothetical protein